MFDQRFFCDRYDLYRPTVATSESGAQTVREPDAPTSAGLPCRFFAAPGIWKVGPSGPDVDGDARMVIPGGQALRPGGKGEQPDCVQVAGRRFVVLACWAAGPQALYSSVLLAERRP